MIAEIGINHEGDVAKAIRMVDDAARAGCECVKFQCHVIEDEMIPNDVVPGNATETIWNIMARCALSEADERALEDVRRGQRPDLPVDAVLARGRRSARVDGRAGVQDRIRRVQQLPARAPHRRRSASR